MIELKEISKIVKEKRLDVRPSMTQEDLSLKADVAVSTIRLLETSKLHDIKISTVKKLFKALNIKCICKLK